VTATTDVATILREDRPSGGVYRLHLDGHEARMTFSRVNDRHIIIDHTEVPEGLRGRGAGTMLLERVIADMRSVGGKITPLCPFAAAQFRRHAEYGDVLAQ
jgi:predicted GNAT family acetyltransferase